MNDFLTLKGGEVDVGGAPEVISVLPFGHVVSQKGEFDIINYIRSREKFRNQ